MRTDRNLGDEFRNSEEWEFDIRDFNVSMTTVETLGGDDGRPSVKRISNSFSGHERNHLFINERGERFHDVSSVSGLDDDGDGRSLAYLDYNRDGWLDVALVNANRPHLSLFENRIGEVSGRGEACFVAVRFEGSNRTATPAPDRTARDGYGAKVRVRAGDLEMLREHRCGDGFAAQNSATMIIGLGDARRADSVVVEWPSGTRREVVDVASGTLLVAWEDPEQSESGEPFERQPYGVGFAERPPRPPSRPWNYLNLDVPVEGDPPLRAWVTMATWCAACKRYAPQVERLREAFSADQLALLGAPVDLKDDADMLARYVEVHRPAYRLLTDLDEESRRAVQAMVATETGADSLPTTLVTDRDGRVVAAFPGVPSVSEIARLLEAP